MADTTKRDDRDNPTASRGEQPERDRTEGTTGREPNIPGQSGDDQVLPDPDEIDDEEEDVDPDRRDNREGNL
ncbi:MAG TPA: hypothetical protein VHJ77_18885 [Vicinamibacterales bacterium]|jgi:hypothetical protein|nr:hypothetical protein [Vicinamibacterales bacterium]